MTSRPLIQAQPPLQFVPPALNPWLVALLPMALPLWLRWQTPLAAIRTEQVERLVDLYRDFQAGKVRFLLAFRHPSTYDPFAMGYLLSQAVPRVARERGVALKEPIHAFFLYDRGIPLWAGRAVGWLLPRLGGTSIQRGKLDRLGLRSARELFVNGPLPLMAAPEGGTNGHSEIVSPLEPGIAQLGFWCAEDLAAAGRSEAVFIVPVGIQYSYLQPPWQALDRLLAELERDTGLASMSGLDRYERLLRVGDRILGQVENFYSRFYQRKLEVQPDFAARLTALLEAALQVAEQFFDLPGKGSLIDRCRRIEQAGWERIFRDELGNLSPTERGLANLIAEETDLRMWHMRLVESFVAVTGSYVRSKPTADRFAETALIAQRTVRRLKGEDPLQVPSLGQQQVRVSVGEPLSVSERFAAYKSNRQGAKQAVATLTSDLQAALEGLI
ncbi:phospholipid/glycerol acyltransferase [Gloeobacter kilaueensis]|uniref:Phospholipid/glycerol acyltransferase n=1 Tax=Gloeobacter kilaueensis (strain ATCC BAA-2537 / CCAP 1431/1 / ULC 316 / JS1) TaxID=1183438 RepID=U5QGA9_GLOK1|nr:phospholipid/glycerol acyltransferase [Gloeobacter kilaueensis]AGY57898.1 phospholipid/glycerol acyltransferase [Gloeobacter kilaueensis JS1]